MQAHPVDVLWTARYHYKPGWRLAKHQHDYFQMLYFISGSGGIGLGDRELPITGGDLLLIKPGCPHSLSADSLVKTLDIKFVVKQEWLCDLLMRSGDLLQGGEPWAVELFEKIWHEGQIKSSLYRELCNLYLAELLLLFVRNNGLVEGQTQSARVKHEFSADWIVERATGFIRKNYAKECSLSEIARLVGRSERHVRQHFKDTLGTSPRSYLHQYRIQKAEDLIVYSDYSLKEIASEVGFKSIHHFTRVFHEVSGETPGNWRAKYHSGIGKDVNIDPEFVNKSWTVQTKGNR
jgi:AraC-like DNA-binding protein